MNTLFDAAQALLALVSDCLGDDCRDYTRRHVETGSPVFDCSELVVQIGSARALSGSCVGKSQLSLNLDAHIVRCCEPVGTLNEAGGYVPPTPEQIEAAVACLVRDVWAVFTCVNCSACDTLGAIRGVVACCDDATGAPEIIWGAAQGGCRSAIVRVPIVAIPCCEVPEPPLAPTLIGDCNNLPASQDGITVDSILSSAPGSVTINGLGLSAATRITVHVTTSYPNLDQAREYNPAYDSQTNLQVILSDPDLVGLTINQIDVWDQFGAGPSVFCPEA